MADIPKIADDFEPVVAEDFKPVSEPKAGLLSNRGANDPYGEAKNLGTTILAGGSHIPGVAGDIEQTGDLIGAGAKSIFDPRSYKDIMAANQAARERKQEERYNKPRSWYDPVQRRPIKPPTGEEIFQEHIKPITGEYEPQTLGGKLFRVFGEAAIPSAIMPGSGLATRGERIIQQAPSLTERALALAARLHPGVVGGAGGVTGYAGSELSGGNPFVALGASALGPAGIESARSGIKRIVPPAVLSREAAAREASGIIGKNATDPKAAFENATKAYEQEPIPGLPKQTIAEASGDEGLAGTEQAVRAAGGPQSDAAFAKREGERNVGRQSALKSTLSPDSDPKAVSEFFGDAQEALDKHTADTLPPVAPADQRGNALRDQVLEQRGIANKQRKALYDAIDPDEKMNVLVPGMRDAAKQANTYKPNVQLEPASQDIINMALKQPPIMSFSDLRTFKQTVEEARARAKMDGNSKAERELGLIKSGINDDMKNAVANQIAHEQEQLAAGHINPEDSLAYRLSEYQGALERERADWYTNRDLVSGEAAEAGPGATQGQGAGRLPGVRGEGGEEGGGPSAAPGDRGVQGNEPNLDPEAVARLKAADQFNRFYKSTYSAGPAGQMLKPGQGGYGFQSLDANLPTLAFPGGDKGYQVTSHVLQAADNKPAAVQILKDTAIDTLRKSMNQGRLSPESLAKWQAKYGQSLRALDEVEPGFSDQFRNVANTQSQLATKFAGRKTAQEGRDLVGGMIRAQDGPTQIESLIKEAKGDPNVVEGLKHLAVDHMLSSASNAGVSGGASIFSGAKFRQMLRERRDSLSKLFTPDHMALMDRLGADFESQQAHEQRMQGPARGSPTARNLELLKDRLKSEHAPTDRIHGGPLSLFAAMENGPVAGLKMWAAAKAVGTIQKLGDALRNRGVKNTNDMIRMGMTDPEIGMRMLKHHNENIGDPHWSQRVLDAVTASPVYAQPGLEDAEKKREGRASGGKVGVDHAKAAAHLVGLVEKARKSEQAKTKPLLGAHDTTVARALELANRAI